MDRTQRDRRNCCPHFCLLLGAVNLNGRPPDGIFGAGPARHPLCHSANPRIALDGCRYFLPADAVWIFSLSHCLFLLRAAPGAFFNSVLGSQRIPVCFSGWNRGWDEVDDILIMIFSWLEQGKVAGTRMENSVPRKPIHGNVLI